MDTLKLHKPIEIDGKTAESIEFDFDFVTGKTIEDICRQLTKTGCVILAQETDPVLHAHIFAAAADIAYSDMQRMSSKDYLRATTIVRDFFYMS